MNLKKLFSGLLAAFVVLLSTSATSQRYGADAPLRQGDKLPEMGSLAQVRESFAAAQYTIVHFWAAYDGQSRADNVRWENLLPRIGRADIAYQAVSLDLSKAIFEHTVRIDELRSDRQRLVNPTERSQVLARCGLDTKFHTYLVDKQGMVIAVDPTPQSLAQIP